MQSDTEKCHTVITVVLPPDDGDDGDVDAVGHRDTVSHSNNSIARPLYNGDEIDDDAVDTET